MYKLRFVLQIVRRYRPLRAMLTTDNSSDVIWQKPFSLFLSLPLFISLFLSFAFKVLRDTFHASLLLIVVTSFQGSTWSLRWSSDNDISWWSAARNRQINFNSKVFTRANDTTNAFDKENILHNSSELLLQKNLRADLLITVLCLLNVTLFRCKSKRGICMYIDAVWNTERKVWYL